MVIDGGTFPESLSKDLRVGKKLLVLNRKKTSMEKDKTKWALLHITVQGWNLIPYHCLPHSVMPFKKRRQFLGSDKKKGVNVWNGYSRKWKTIDI